MCVTLQSIVYMGLSIRKIKHYKCHIVCKHGDKKNKLLREDKLFEFLNDSYACLTGDSSETDTSDDEAKAAPEAM